MTVVTLMRTTVWHDQGIETVRQRFRDVDEVAKWFRKLNPEIRCEISKGAVSELYRGGRRRSRDGDDR